MRKHKALRCDIHQDRGFKNFAKLVGGFCDNPDSQLKTPEELTSAVIRNLDIKPISNIQIIVTVKFLKNLWDDGLSKNDRIPKLVSVVNREECLFSHINRLPNFRLVKTESGYGVVNFSN